MSVNYDSENNQASIDDDDDDHDHDVVGDDNSELINNQEMSSREVNYDSNNSNDDGVIVNADNNGSGGDSDGVVVSEDAGREDMFLDAPEDLGADGRDSPAPESTEWEEDRGHEPETRFRGLDNEMQNDYMVDEMERLRAMLDKTVNEKESIVREHEDEIEMATKGIANLRDQMRDLISQQLLLDENKSRSHDQFHGDAEQAPLLETIHECSMFLRSIMEEFQDLNAKSAESAVLREVVNSYLNSVQNESAEVQFQKDQYMEDAANRMLSSFASVVYVGDLLDNSLVGRMAHIEKSAFSVIESYNWFLYQSDHLRQCLAQVRPDLAEQTDYGVIFTAVSEELLGFKKRETDFVEKMSYLESENRKLMEQIDTVKAIADGANAELEKLKAELEQEKHRYANTKEKLSLAVTKGKALVQQRDSLKQTLADKTSELEKCLVELNEKSSALEAAELVKEEWVKSQMLGASLQETIDQKDLLLEKLEGILVQSGVPEVLTSKDITERIRWLVDDRDALKDVSHKFHLLANTLLSIDLPESFSFSDLESRLGWLTKSYDEAKTEIGKLQEEVTRTKESLTVATSEIGALKDENSRVRETAASELDRLIALLSTVLVEKDYATLELEDMSSRFDTIVLRERQVISEKEHMLRILLESSGVTVVDGQPYEIDLLVEQCLVTLKEQSSSAHESSEFKDQFCQILQDLVYVKDQDLALHEIVLEEETHKMKMEMDNLMKAFEEIATLKEEKEKLQRDLDRTEEKSGIIREKLSMAVKKGKGLFQERESLKQLIDGKSSEIEKLKLELEQKELAISNYESESSKLSAQVQCIVKLEEDLVALGDQRNQLERDLSASNKLLNDLIESINGIVSPVGSSFEEPIEKLNWLSGYISECEVVKAQAHQQLEIALLEIETMTAKVSETQSIIKSLEEALGSAEVKISQLTEEKTKLEGARMSAQEQLEKAMQDAYLFTETNVAKNLLENALALAETNVSRLGKEKEEAESSRSLAEAELDKARSEITDLTTKLSNATETLQKLEGTISDLETRVTMLSDENTEAQGARTSLENELNKLKEEANTQDNKLQEALSSIKSLEDALSKAKNDISELDDGKKAAEQEILTLNAKLSTCMEELAGTHGNLESRSLELFDHLKGLEVLKEDKSLFSSLEKCYKSKVEHLKDIEEVLNNIRSQYAKLSPEIDPFSQESILKKLLSTSLDDAFRLDDFSSHSEALDGDDIFLYVQKIVEGYHTRKQTFAEKVDGFSSFMCECDASIVQEFLAMSKLVSSLVEEQQFFDQKVKSMEQDYQDLANKVNPLEEEISLLMSACTEATHMLQLEVDKRMAELNSSSDDQAEDELKQSGEKKTITTEKLLFAARKACIVCEHLENSRSKLLSTIDDLQNNLNELKLVADKTGEERDLSNKKVCDLETDLAELQNICSELRFKLDNYQDIEVSLTEKDVEISSLQSSLTTKQKEAEEALFWASHMKSVMSRANDIEVSIEESQEGDLEPQNSAEIEKLLLVIDKFPELQRQYELLLHEKEEMQTTLTDQQHEIEHLKERVQEVRGLKEELAMLRSKFINIESSLVRVIQKFPSSSIAEDQSALTLDDHIQILEKQALATISESEILKSKIHELELKVKESLITEQELAGVKEKFLNLEAGVQRIIKNFGGDMDLKPLVASSLIQVLEKMLLTVTLECEKLRAKDHETGSEIWKESDELELAEAKGQLVDFETGLQKIIHKLRGDATGELGPTGVRDLVQLLEKMVMAVVKESENSKSKANELDLKLHESQRVVDELLLKVKALEDSLRSRVVPAETIQERSIFEAPSQPSASEISEVEDAGPVSKPTISPVPSSTQLRTMWKGPSSEHIAVNIDSESSRLIDYDETVEDKGHVFKSLNTSGLVPIQGKMIADRIDGIWVSGGRLLMSRPRARLSLIAYWLFLHIWLLGTIL